MIFKIIPLALLISLANSQCGCDCCVYYYYEGWTCESISYCLWYLWTIMIVWAIIACIYFGLYRKRKIQTLARMNRIFQISQQAMESQRPNINIVNVKDTTQTEVILTQPY